MSVFRMKNDKVVDVEKRLLLEKRLVLGVTAMTVLGFLLEIIAVSTDSWLLFYIENGLYQNGTNRFLHRVYSGLWRICKVEWKVKDDPSTEAERCEFHDFFPTQREIIYDESMDRQILDYMRTGCAFSIITIMLMALVHVFAIYTVRRPRYTIKRLTALLHLMTAACIVVMNEVFIRTTEYADQNLPKRIPEKAVHEYGYSFVLSWIVFVFYILAGLVFLFVSQKKKPKLEEYDPNFLQDDEPMQLGR